MNSHLKQVERKEIRQLEKLMLSTARTHTHIVKQGMHIENYDEIMNNLQSRYHTLTGKYYHLQVRESWR